MATDYKTVIGLEALEREFEQLAKLARPVRNTGPGLFSAPAVKPAQVSPKIFDYADENNLHALISVQAEKGEPLVKYYDLSDKPKMSPDSVREMARKFIEACRKTEDWHTYFSDHREHELRAVAEWTAASVDERPANPPLSRPKALPEERLEDAKKFVEGVNAEPTLTTAPGKS